MILVSIPINLQLGTASNSYANSEVGILLKDETKIVTTAQQKLDDKPHCFQVVNEKWALFMQNKVVSVCKDWDGKDQKVTL